MSKFALVFTKKQDGGVELSGYNTGKLAMHADEGAEGAILTAKAYNEGLQHVAALLTIAPQSLSGKLWNSVPVEQVEEIGSVGLAALVVCTQDFADEAALQTFLVSFFEDIAKALPVAKQALEMQEQKAYEDMFARLNSTIEHFGVAAEEVPAVEAEVVAAE